MSSKAESGQGPWQVKRVNSRTGPVATTMSDALRKPKSIRGQTKLLWSYAEETDLSVKQKFHKEKNDDLGNDIKVVIRHK